MNFGTININSLAKSGKIKNLTDNLTQQKITILALQEMRNTLHKTRMNYKSTGFTKESQESVMKNVPLFGNGFIDNTFILDSVKDFKAYTDRIATLTIKAANKT